MNHPSLKSLQDYFDAEKSFDSVKVHLENCDRCSLIVSNMAKVDILFSRSASIKVRTSIKDKIFANASLLLEEKREQIQSHSRKKEKRKQQRKEVVVKISNFSPNALPELKLPIIQSVGLGIFLLIFTKLSLTHKETHYYKIIETDTVVTYSELQGDYDEDS